MNTTHYSMIIEWSDEDQAFIVTVPELPGCRTHGNTYEDAVREGKEAIEGWLEVARSMNWTLPTPKIFAA